MSNYNGYLLKFGNNIMPNKYITAFSSTPNQRLETSAERDQNGIAILNHQLFQV